MRTAVSGRDLKERYLNTRGIRRQSRDEALLDFLFERPARPHSAPGQRTPYSSASLPRRARRFRFLNALASGAALACIAATCAGHFLSRQSCAAESSTPPSWYLEGKGGRDRPLGRELRAGAKEGLTAAAFRHQASGRRALSYYSELGHFRACCLTGSARTLRRCCRNAGARCRSQPA